MKLSGLFLCLLPIVCAPAFVSTDAQACGGCIISESETTQVTGHRMILSVSQTQTTLWDQIKYSGDPLSFAWVLPIKGTVEVGLSSDAMFTALEQATAVTIQSPTINCLPPDCAGGPPNAGNGSSSGSSGSGGAGGGGVVVIAEEVVGPYETVQLSSTDPNALKTWLTDKQYNIPADIQPVIDAYVADGFNFLALKLVPTLGVDSMRPVRITTMGATPVLPLRMVAAGTGPKTAVTLFILGEGRYETTNPFTNFTIDGSQLVWDWDTSSSNYSTIKQDAFDASNGRSWLVEAAEPLSRYGIVSSLLWSAEFDPANSGYGLDPMGPSALDECTEDLEDLFAGIPESTTWVTRLNAELSRAALGTDLQVQASADQSSVTRWFQVTNTTGTQPACPPPPDWCQPVTTGGGPPPVDTNPWDDQVGDDNGTGGGTASCAVAAESSVPATFGLLAATFFMSVARRRTRRSSSRSS